MKKWEGPELHHPQRLLYPYPGALNPTSEIYDALIMV